MLYCFFKHSFLQFKLFIFNTRNFVLLKLVGSIAYKLVIGVFVLCRSFPAAQAAEDLVRLSLWVNVIQILLYFFSSLLLFLVGWRLFSSLFLLLVFLFLLFLLSCILLFPFLSLLLLIIRGFLLWFLLFLGLKLSFLLSPLLFSSQLHLLLLKINNISSS